METRQMIEPVISIDGSQGEGGGQIVRTSLALSMLTGRAVEISNIRAGRDKPGLMRQHLTAVRAAVEISGAKVVGDEVGSRCLQFTPQTVRPGSYTFAVGTAGSATLVLQTVLPALLVASGESQLVLEGGTHNPWAPPFDFLANTYLPLVNRMGPQVTATLERHGFYPAGGGRFSISIQPTAQLQGFDLLERGELRSRRAMGIVAKLPAQIAERELKLFAEKLQWSPEELQIVEVADAAGPGNIVMMCVEYEHVAETFTGFGQVGVRAENVAAEVLKQYRNYQTAGVPVGTYLADQLLLPLGIAAWQTGRGGSFRTSGLSRHATTHIDLLRQFLEIPISVERDSAGCLVSVGR
jgi:RNA 3'-terminal phosphate cyclase (ATP)